jgi:hypothetical protein
VRFSIGDVLTNLTIRNEWYKSKESTRRASNWTTIYWTLRNVLPNFWILVFAFILFAIHFCMIECNFDIINLFIYVVNDVQYVVTPYGSKIN